MESDGERRVSNITRKLLHHHHFTARGTEVGRLVSKATGGVRQNLASDPGRALEHVIGKSSSWDLGDHFVSASKRRPSISCRTLYMRRIQPGWHQAPLNLPVHYIRDQPPDFLVSTGHWSWKRRDYIPCHELPGLTSTRFMGRMERWSRRARRLWTPAAWV